MKISTCFSGFLVLFFTSCSINIHPTFQGLYSYYNKTKKENPKLFKENDENVCDLKYDGFVYLTNGEKLKKCLDKGEKSLVYIWNPKCKSRVCIPLNTIQEICDSKNINLYVVAEYYDGELMRKKT